MNTTSTTDTERSTLLSEQFAAYPDNHSDRQNLILHIATVPLFMAGTLAFALSPVLGLGAAVGGLATMALVIAVQGRGHRSEAPARPFTSPLNFAVRIFAEQWITFPRFALSGALARALRNAR